jgi:hypothetical protein
VAAGGPDEPEQDADGGGLAGPVRAEEAVNLAWSYGQVETVERAGLAEGLGEAVDLDDGNGVGQDGFCPGTKCS